LFQTELDKHSGVIVHLANKDFEGRTKGWWFAGDIVSWDQIDAFHFLAQPAKDIRRLMRLLLKASPIRQILFLTDYQGGPRRKRITRQPLTLAKFWALQANGTIRYNTLYRIKEDRRTTA